MDGGRALAMVGKGARNRGHLMVGGPARNKVAMIKGGARNRAT